MGFFHTSPKLFLDQYLTPKMLPFTEDPGMLSVVLDY